MTKLSKNSTKVVCGEDDDGLVMMRAMICPNVEICDRVNCYHRRPHFESPPCDDSCGWTRSEHCIPYVEKTKTTPEEPELVGKAFADSCVLPEGYDQEPESFCGQDPESQFHNSHYKLHDIDTIETLLLSGSKEELVGFLRGNIIKYVMRFDKKGQPQKDLDKIDYYLEILKQVHFGYKKYKNQVCSRVQATREEK